MSSLREEHGQVLFIGHSPWGKTAYFYTSYLVPAVSYTRENTQGLIVGAGGGQWGLALVVEGIFFLAFKIKQLGDWWDGSVAEHVQFPVYTWWLATISLYCQWDPVPSSDLHGHQARDAHT